MKKLFTFFILFYVTISFSQLNEGFEGATFPPTGWAVFDNGIGLAQSWNETTNAALVYEGTKAAFLNRENVTDGTFALDWLVTPQVTVPANGQLRFYTRKTQNGNFGSIYSIRVSTASQTTDTDYTTIQTWDETTLVTTYNVYEQKIVSLTAYAGQNIYIAFVMENDNGDRWLVDNVYVDQECLDITSANVSAISDTSVNLSWNNPSGATQWQIEYGAVGFTPGTGTIVSANTNPFNLTGLTASTEYDFYVRADCLNENYSGWFGPTPFTTAVCPISEQCNFVFILTDSFGDGWNGNTMTISQNGTEVATIGSTFTTGAGPINIDVPLCANQPYELFWNTGGNWAGEVGVEIQDPFGESLFTHAPGTSLQGQTLFTGVAACTPPTCPDPSNIVLSNIDTNAVDISWVDNASATQWEIIVQPAGTGYPTGSGTVVTTNPYTFTGLTNGVNYEVYIRAICSTTDASTWEGPSNFSTLVCPATQQCNYSFIMTDSFGDGWNGNTMTISQNGVTMGVIGGTFTAGAGPDTVQIPLCDGQPFQLFWNTGGNWAGEVGVEIQDPFGDNLFTHAPGTNLQGQTLFTGVVACTPPTCQDPSNIVLSNIDTNAVDISWVDNASATQWEIIVQPAGTGYPTGSGTVVTTNPYTYTGLTNGVNYEVYIRAICSATDASIWEGPSNFSTLVCPATQQCNYTFIMTDSFGDGWNGNTMTISQNGVTMGVIGGTFTAGAGPVTVQVPLCDGQPFQLFWNTGGNWAGEVGVEIEDPFGESLFIHAPGNNLQGTVLYSGNVSCTPPPCPKPQNLSVSNVTENSADLNWIEVGSATNWQIVVQAVGAGVPTGTGTPVSAPAPPYTVTGLNSGTQYEFYVLADCGSVDGLSTWAGPFVFATLIANDECEDAITVLTNNDLSCANFASGVLIGATASSVPTACFGTADDDVWFEFVATSTSHIISIYDITGSTTDLMHAVYQGNICGAMTELYCSDPEVSTATSLVIGETYKVRIYSWTGTPNQTTAFNLCIGTPPLAMNNTTYTVEQLVTDVLIGSNCAQVSNITWSTGTNFGSDNGIAYFEENYPSLGFTSGIALTTGNALNASGPNTTGLSDGDFTWPGDTQLFNYIQSTGIDPFLNSYNNATVLEFDFVPLTNNISFDFIFASEEYGTFQCDFSDAFAFFLTENATGTTTNLAVLPNTTTPISVVTIRDNAYNGGCDSQNPQYFDVYNAFPNDPNVADTNFNGQTVVLTAQSPVVPNTSYHIKLVIADRNDSALDSAVFLKAGSFDIGSVDLGEDFLESAGTAICAGDTTTIQSGLDPNNYTFEWMFNGTIINGENNADLIVSDAGTYTLNATYTGTSCIATDSIIIEFYEPIAAQQPNNLFACNASGFASFDLTENNVVVLNGLNATDYTLTYFTSQTDAENNVNEISTPTSYTNTVAINQTIYVRIENNVSQCYSIYSFDLQIGDLTPQFTISSDTAICQGNNFTITTTPINYNENDVIYSWTFNGTALTDVTSSITVNQAGVYEVTINNSGCTATQSSTITVNPNPELTSITSNSPICSGNDAIITLQGTANATVVYQVEGQSSSTITLDATGTGVITIVNPSGNFNINLLEISLNDCVVTLTNSLSIEVLPLPTASVTAMSPICNGENAVFTLIGTPNAIVNYAINGGTTETVTLDASGNATITKTAVSLNQQIVLSNATLGVCSQILSASAEIIVNDIPTITSLTANGPICSNSDAIFSILGTPNAVVSYTLNGGTVQTITLDSTGNGTITSTNAAIDITLNLTNIDLNGCSQALSNSSLVNIIISPIVDEISDITTCDSYVLPALTVGNYYTGMGGTGTMLNAGDVLTSSQTIYVFAQTNTLPNCTDEDSFEVTITPLEVPTFAAIEVCMGSNATSLPSISENNISGSWSPSVINTSAAGYFNYVFTPSSGECATPVTLSVRIKNCNIQNGISPNGDGLNDSFDLSDYNVDKLEIFNRYGMKMYDKNNYRNEWYGTTNDGDELPDGTYYYVIYFNDMEAKTGWIYINREY